MLADDEAESLVEFLPWRLLEDDWLQVMEEWQMIMMVVMRLHWKMGGKEEHERIKSMEREEEKKRKKKKKEKEKRRMERVKSKRTTPYPNLHLLTLSLSLFNFAFGMLLLYFVHVLGAVLRAH